QRRAAEADPVLDAEDGREAEAGLREVGLQLVEDGAAETRGDVARHDLGDAADRVLLFAHPLDELDHLRGGDGVGTAADVRLTVRQPLDRLERDVLGDGRADVAYL